MRWWGIGATRPGVSVLYGIQWDDSYDAFLMYEHHFELNISAATGEFPPARRCVIETDI
jgi:hypothetical protein